jgi:glutamine amidotransferase
MRVVVVDTGFANYHSVIKAIERAGSEISRLSVVRSRDPEMVNCADKLVMPGQGGFKDCAAAFADGLGGAVLGRIKAGAPFFGICLGLQVLFETSEEAPGVRGLGLLSGSVAKLSGTAGLKIPHMGWNQLEASVSGRNVAWSASAAGRWFYFDHSFHATPADPSLVLATVSYGNNRVTAAVGRENVFATQFHPEKSQAAGLSLLTEFLKT